MYTKEIRFQDYLIEIEYYLLSTEDRAMLFEYTVYQNNTEVLIPCRLEAEFIQKRVDKELERITISELGNMIRDLQDADDDLEYDRWSDR
jgi:hypothetical protein